MHNQSTRLYVTTKHIDYNKAFDGNVYQVKQTCVQHFDVQLRTKVVFYGGLHATRAFSGPKRQMINSYSIFPVHYFLFRFINKVKTSKNSKNIERFTNLRVILAQGPC